MSSSREDDLKRLKQDLITLRSEGFDKEDLFAIVAPSRFSEPLIETIEKLFPNPINSSPPKLSAT